jgi:hypothetical protein
MCSFFCKRWDLKDTIAIDSYLLFTNNNNKTERKKKQDFLSQLEILQMPNTPQFFLLHVKIEY